MIHTAFHNCKNIRLHVKTESRTCLSLCQSNLPLRHEAALMSCRIPAAYEVCGWTIWRTPWFARSNLAKLHNNCYISIISKCFLRISVVFSRVWCCNASLNKDSFWMDITCNLTRHIGLLPIWIELPVFLWHFSFDTHFLLNCYTWLNVTSLLPQYTSSNLTQINYRVYACNKDKK